MIGDVEWNSPAWKAGVRRGDRIDAVEKLKIAPMLADHAPGDVVTLAIVHAGASHDVKIALAVKQEKRFTLTPIAHPDPLQKSILASF